MKAGEDMSSKAENAEEEFWRELLEYIIDKGRMIPKFQVERAIGPILGFFLAKNPSLLGGNVTLLATEFPLKKIGSLQSTNIDWLLFDEDDKQLVFLELKTDSSSFKREQLERYLKFLKDPSPWVNLTKGLRDIRRAPSPYQYKYEGLEQGISEAILDCDGIEKAGVNVIYLIPDTTKELFSKTLNEYGESYSGIDLAERVKCLSFKDLRNNLQRCKTNALSVHLGLLCKVLCKLDSEGKQKPAGESAINYQERNVSLESVLELCRGEHPVLVGYQDGMKNLLDIDAAYLESRRYRWDWANPDDEAPGPKTPSRWIDGEKFLKIVEAKRSERLRSEEDSLRLASGIEKALLDNRELRLCQIIELISSDSGVPLSEMEDADVIEALAARN